MKRSILLLLIAVVLAPAAGIAQDVQESKIKWISIEEAEKLNKENPKKIMIDVYTDWCGWCKKMDKDT